LILLSLLFPLSYLCFIHLGLNRDINWCRWGNPLDFLQSYPQSFHLCLVRCSAIEGILHRYHSCGPMLMLEEVAHDWHLGALGYLGAIGLLSLHVDVWRLIFLKLSLPRDGVRGCSAPCNSILYVRSFFKNGTDLTVYVITSVCTCFITSKRCYCTYEYMCGSY
jgi:hypothetical protein